MENKKQMDVCNMLSSQDVEQIRQQNNLQHNYYTQNLEPFQQQENNVPQDASMVQHILTYAPYNDVPYLQVLLFVLFAYLFII